MPAIESGYARAYHSVRRELGDSDLVYFGTRGTDALPLFNFAGRLAGVFSQIAPINGLQEGAEASEGALYREICLENIARSTHYRVRADLDTYDIDTDPDRCVVEYRDGIHDWLESRLGRSGVTVLPYRTNAIMEYINFSFAGHANFRFLGNFSGLQKMMEFKPWVEQSLKSRLAGIGAPILPWHYYPVSLGQAALIQDMKRIVGRSSGKYVVRRNYSDGGVGLHLLENPGQIQAEWFSQPDVFFSVCEYFEDAIPINVNAVAFADGAVRMHPASFQIIGNSACTGRRFGFCGNDFAAVRDLSDEVLQKIETMTRATGKFLASHGYRGAFGIDALIVAPKRYEKQPKVYFTELNARFQGSSVHATRIMQSLGLPDLYLDHMAAFLEIGANCYDESSSGPTLAHIVRNQPDLAHVVVHNQSKSAVRLKRSERSKDYDGRVDLLPDPGVRVSPGGALADLVFSRRVTPNGYALDSSARELAEIVSHLFSEASA